MASREKTGLCRSKQRGVSEGFKNILFLLKSSAPEKMAPSKDHYKEAKYNVVAATKLKLDGIDGRALKRGKLTSPGHWKD